MKVQYFSYVRQIHINISLDEPKMEIVLFMNDFKKRMRLILFLFGGHSS